jgi:hypothetical protein
LELHDPLGSARRHDTPGLREVVIARALRPGRLRRLGTFRAPSNPLRPVPFDGADQSAAEQRPGGSADIPIEEGETYPSNFAYSDATSTVDDNYIRYTMTSGPQTIVPDSWNSRSSGP